METFIKKYIKSADDLPKEPDSYSIQLKNGEGSIWNFTFEGDVGYNCIKRDWLREVDHYFLPCPELLELIKAQQKLIDFYEKNILDNSVFLAMHHITASCDDIAKGYELHARIETLNKEIGL